MSDDKITRLEKRQDETDKELADVHTKIAVSDERHKSLEERHDERLENSEERQDKTDALIRWGAKLLAAGSVGYLLTGLLKKVIAP